MFLNSSISYNTLFIKSLSFKLAISIAIAYNSSLLKHSSICFGILSFIVYIGVLVASIYYALNFIERIEREYPDITRTCEFRVSEERVDEKQKKTRGSQQT